MPRWYATENIHKQRHELTYHLNRGNDAFMPNRCKGKQVHNGIRHYRSFPACRHGRQCAYAIRRDSCRDDHKIRPNNIQKTHMVQQTWQTYVICTTKKALYGTLQAALLFWKLLSETLQEWGFVLNPSDKFVANKNIEGKQCTIIWHVDDLKKSHANKDIVEDILKTKRQIQTRKSTHNMLWNGPRVPRHENQL